MFDWPESVGANADSIRAAVFAGETAKITADFLITRDDGRFLELAKIGKNWRVASGDFTGNGSKIDSQIVRVDSAGRPIVPKKGILRFLPGNNGAECAWQEAIEIGLHFVDLGRMPLGFTWWWGERGA